MIILKMTSWFMMKNKNKNLKAQLGRIFYDFFIISFLSALTVSFLFGENIMTRSDQIRGVYKIENLKNGKVYIGSSTDIRLRILSHKSLLKKNTHYSIQLQNDWNKFNPENFSFEIIEEIKDKRKSLLKREGFWQYHYIKTNLYNDDLINPKNGRKLYSKNRRKMLSESGRKRTHSKKTRNKIASSHLGFKHSEKTKKKMSLSKIGENNPLYGEKRCKETCRNISKGLSLYFKNGGISHNKNKKIPEKTKLKMSIAAKERWKKRNLK